MPTASDAPAVDGGIWHLPAKAGWRRQLQAVPCRDTTSHGPLYFSPFKYFDAALLLRNSGLDPLFVGLALAIIVVCMAGAYLNYARRDLYI